MSTFTLFLSVALIEVSRGQVSDIIYKPYASGPEVVRRCIDKIHSPTFGMLDDNNFMWRVAYAMSDFGRDTGNIGYGGIWQLSEIAFEDTKDTRAHSRLPRKYEKIYKAYGIDWTTVKYTDLIKPFYSALAARLYMSNSPTLIPPAHDVQEQAIHWKFQYMRGSGDIENFKRKTYKLMDGKGSPKAPDGVSDYCSIDGGCGDSISPESYNTIGGIRMEASHPIKSKLDLFTSTQDIGDWTTLCLFLGASDGVMDELKHSTKQPSTKKQECLTDVYDNTSPSWETVARVVAHHVRKLNLACDIAEKYLGMNNKKCTDRYKRSKTEL